MVVTVTPSSLSGILQAPASKSAMQRACAAALVAAGKTIIRNPGHSNDDRAALDIIRNLGAVIKHFPDYLEITSKGVKPVSANLHCGESGLSIRMFTPLAALSDQPITITGSGSLVTRPMDFFDDILPALGVQITSQAGRLPLIVRGPLIPQSVTIDGSMSSQFLTGLLLAFSVSGARDVSIKVTNLKSRPYIDLTLDVMRKFGLRLPQNRNYEEFYFEDLLASGAAVQRTYTVEGDWSGAAFLLVAGALAGPLTIQGLDVHSTQADKAILQALMNCGSGISIGEHKISLRPMPLKAFQFDATDSPDLFPPLVALATYCSGKSVIRGVSRLAHKESNRALTLQQEFSKMGVPVALQDDLMIIEGGHTPQAARVTSHHDHRIAMACAVAALKASGEVTIDHAEAINKSYPDFYTHLQESGAILRISESSERQL